MGIKVIGEPSVYVVGRQQINDDELDRFLKDEGVEQWTTDTDIAGQKLVECAGRLCYKSYAKPRPGGNAAYINHILEVGHGSVLEHSVFSLIITGVSRSFTHELVRHRVGFGYSQVSQRFVDESEGAMVMPPLVSALGGTKHRWWLITKWERMASEAQANYAELSEEIYNLLLVDDFEASGYVLTPLTWDDGQLDLALRWLKLQPTEYKTRLRKRSREAARSILPNAAETQIFVTGNARAFRHFIEIRGDESADAEIRNVAVKVLAGLKVEAPNIFGDIEVHTNPATGEPHTAAKYRKV